MEHPSITEIEKTGYCGKVTEPPICPICGKECEEIYADKHGEIFACDECVVINSAWDSGECFPVKEDE